MARDPAFNDQEVIARCRQGDEDAWRALVERYQNMVYSVARSVAGAAAEDVVQETFIRVFRKLHTFRDDAKFSTWLYRVAFNCACDAAGRRRAAGGDPAELDLPDERPGPAARAESEEHARLAREALGRLKPEYRRVLELYYLLGKSYGETAAVMSLPLGTVKSHIHRGKASLLRELTRMGVAPCLVEGL